jgi:hypothetical protein
MPNSGAYWFLMQVGMVIGFCTPWPANVRLVKRGIKAATYASLAGTHATPRRSVLVSHRARRATAGRADADHAKAEVLVGRVRCAGRATSGSSFKFAL